jgi:hypothetical protein
MDVERVGVEVEVVANSCSLEDLDSGTPGGPTAPGPIAPL